LKEKTLEVRLTTAQKEQLKKEIGKEVPGVKLNLEELEVRVAPRITLN
jgi:hypothetical protein